MSRGTSNIPRKVLTIALIPITAILLLIYNITKQDNIPIKQVTYITSPAELSIPKEIEPNTLRLLDQNKIDHIQRIIDKSTISVKYLKNGLYDLTSKGKIIQKIQVGPSKDAPYQPENCNFKDTQPNLPKLRYCVQTWYNQSNFREIDTTTKALNDFLDYTINSTTTLSDRWQCQEIIYLYAELISDKFPLKEILTQTQRDLCGDNQYLVRGLFVTKAHATEGLPSDFDSLYRLCKNLSLKNQSSITAHQNCKSALIRSINRYYYLNPKTSIEICQSIESILPEESKECEFLIYNEYIADLRYLDISNLKNELIIQDQNYINQKTPELICLTKPHPGCWEASALYLADNYTISIPNYLNHCTQKQKNQTICQKGLQYLIGKLNSQFTQSELKNLCRLTQNPSSCENATMIKNKKINKDKIEKINKNQL
jgi:hypothetical protein